MATPLRVLLIEDDEADALLLLRVLQKGGYEVTHTRVETEAQVRAELMRAECDIVISDYVLPGFSGPQALQILKESDLDLPFILVSGQVSTEVAVEVVKSSADDYVSKDRLERLVPAVQSALIHAQRRHEARLAGPTPTVQPHRKFGIRARLMSGFAAVALLVGLVGGLSAFWHYRDAEPHARAVAVQMARAFAVAVHKLDETIGAEEIFFDDPTRIQELTDDVFRLEGRDFEVVDTQMKIVADVIHKDIGTFLEHDASAVVAQTLQDGIVRTFVEWSADHPDGIRQVAVPVRSHTGRIEGAVITDYVESYEQAKADAVREATLFLVITLIGMGAALGMGWMTGRAIVAPISALQEAADRLGQGDLKTTIRAETTDELGDLASAFEQMRAQLKKIQAEESMRQTNVAIAASVHELERHATELHLLRDMIDLVQGSVSPDEAFDIIQRYLARLFPTETGALYLLTPTRAELEQVAAWGERVASLAPPFALEDCWALRRGHLHHARMSRGDATCRHMSAADVREHICVPMLIQGEALGILCLSHSGDTDTRMGEESFVTLAQTLANSIGLSVANLRLRDELRRLSIRDTLTGLFNRRYMDETLRREILRAKRAKSTLGVIMLDIDHFKRVNDTYGHEAGDAILSTLGGFLERHVRGEDVACRYGGEEFTLILPGTSLEIARDRAEQLRVGVQALVVRVADRPLEAVTLSLGVAVMPDHGETAETILQAADAALYRAKQGGRDRVEVARSLIVSLPGSRHSEETPHHSRP